MKTIGVVGGIGPESTIDYYRSLVSRLRESGHAADSRVLIISIDLDRLLDLAGRDGQGELTEYLLEAVETLARGGAGIALFAANTPHVVFDGVQRRASIPLVSIVEAAREAAHAMGLGRVGLLGTRFTMRGQFYPSVFAARRIDVIAPRDEDLDFVHDKYVTELVRGEFRPGTRAGFVAVLDYPLPLLDTTRIHVEATVAAVLADSRSQA